MSQLLVLVGRRVLLEGGLEGVSMVSGAWRGERILADVRMRFVREPSTLRLERLSKLRSGGLVSKSSDCGRRRRRRRRGRRLFEVVVLLSRRTRREVGISSCSV